MIAEDFDRLDCPAVSSNLLDEDLVDSSCSTKLEALVRGMALGGTLENTSFVSGSME